MSAELIAYRGPGSKGETDRQREWCHGVGVAKGETDRQREWCHGVGVADRTKKGEEARGGGGRDREEDREWRRKEEREGGREKKREAQRDRERERDRDRYTDRQTDRQTDSETVRDRQRETKTERDRSVIDYTALMNTVGCCGMNECWVLLFFVMEIVMSFDRLLGLALYRNVCYYRHCYHYCYYSMT